MLRFTLTEMLLFLAPFAAFAGYLVIRRQPVFAASSWNRGPTFWLAMAGLLIVAFGLIEFGAFKDGVTEGTWKPTHFEKGVLVPGRFE